MTGLETILKQHDIVFGSGDDETDVDGAICEYGDWRSPSRSVDDLYAEHRAHVADQIRGWLLSDDSHIEARAEAWEEGAMWAAEECGAVHEGAAASTWLVPQDNPYRNLDRGDS